MKALVLKTRRGFTLIELLVVVLIIGILAAIAVPQYFKVVEKGKFAESMQWLSGLKGAQERYLARYGAYSSSTASTVLDVNLGTLTKFTSVSITATSTPNWTVSMQRTTPTPAVYGAYIVTYVAPPGTLTCSNTDCTNDLLP
jgi:prepilin-type N-terminal cleavage/methylation domain-containing protein